MLQYSKNYIKNLTIKIYITLIHRSVYNLKFENQTYYSPVLSIYISQPEINKLSALILYIGWIL